MTRLGDVLTLPDADALADLATFVGRAKRVDPDGAARLVGHGDVLAVYVSPVHGSGGPTVLGLRTLQLALASTVDVTVALAALTDRLARTGPELPDRPDLAGPVALAVPPAEAVGAAWAGMAPPRRGWQGVGEVAAETLRTRAAAGVAEVAAGAPEGSGAAAVGALRSRIWGRSLVEEPAELAGLPAGVAYAADALGFVDDDLPAAVYRSGPWWRVTSGRGHVLARPPALH
jgi:hypothetical protein